MSDEPMVDDPRSDAPTEGPSLPEPTASPLEQASTGPSTAVAGLAAVVPILALFFGCGLTGLAFVGEPGVASEMGMVGLLPLLLFVMSGVLLAPILFLLGRGRAVPTFVVLGFASLPWLAGLVGGWFSMMGLGRSMSLGDPSVRSMLMAQAVSETLLSGVTSGIAGGTLLIASAFGVGLAAMGQRAPRRALWAGILGFGATLPLAMSVAYGLLSRDYFVLIPAAGALLVAVSVALGVAGAGEDERGRSGALASAVPWLGGLGVAALASAVVHKGTMMMFGAIAMADPDRRITLLAHGAEEMSPVIAARWLVPLTVVLAGLTAAGWSATRKRPGTLHFVGAAALVLGFGGVLGFDSLTRTLIVRGVARPAVMAPAGFEAASADTRLGDVGDPDLFVGATEILAADGSGASRSLQEAFSQHRHPVEAGSDWLDAEPEVVVSFDERAPASVVHGLTAAAREVGLRSFAVSVSRPMAEAEAEVLETAVPALWVAAAAFQEARSLKVMVASEADLPRARTDPMFLHTTLGNAVPTSLEARSGVAMEDRELGADAFGYDSFDAEDEAPTPVWVVLGPQANAESLLTLVTRLHMNGHVPVLVEELPDATPPTAPRGILGALTGGDASGGLLAAMGGTSADAPDALGPRRRANPVTTPTNSRTVSSAAVRVRFQDTSVRGSLSSSVIRSVMRRNLAGVRTCYQTHLARSPRAEGRVDLRFVIGAGGRVTEADARTSTLRGLDACLEPRVRGWRFPSPAGGGTVVVDQPILFFPN